MSHSKPEKRPATILEPIADFDQELEDNTLGGPEIAPLVPPADRTTKPEPVPPKQKTASYRPTLRPPIALLQIHDDGSKSDETFRIRKSSCVIGRSEGDVQIEHDSLISGRHAEISRMLEDGKWKWYLNDLDSTNGTYARISKAILSDGMFLLIGAKRYRFDLGSATAKSTPDSSANRGPSTQMWPTAPEETVSGVRPTLVEVLSDTDGEAFTISSGGETWIGRDSSKVSIVLDDAMVGSRHARIVQETDDSWSIEVTQTRNGLWVKINTKQELGSSASFQCGEQRFNFRLT